MLTIGTLSKKTGTKVQTIRYYEQIGVMNEPGRSAGGQRRYFEKDLDRLAFIRHSRQLGFSLESIRELLDLSDNPSRSCADADVIARRQLTQVERRIKGLQALKKELKRMVTECEGNSVAECKIIEVLRDHSECLTEHQNIDVELA
ncbi:MAG: helix-turn-helix domain-containing protein [Paracoccaceae bacterium]|nr:helix-turn-helix domain-containing protein [Paracoccaceae bacterium]MDG2259493.1 helix-turn-helix domain-containing protein [Paracoccaceae bacterium]